jgi:hypothetical protein
MGVDPCLLAPESLIESFCKHAVHSLHAFAEVNCILAADRRFEWRSHQIAVAAKHCLVWRNACFTGHVMVNPEDSWKSLNPIHFALHLQLPERVADDSSTDFRAAIGLRPVSL